MLLLRVLYFRLTKDVAMRTITLAFIILFFGSAVTVTTEEETVPLFDPITDVVFLVHTRNNPSVGQIVDIDDMSTVINSNFSSSRQTRVLIHGAWGDRYNPTNTILYPAYLQAGDFSKFYNFSIKFLC